MSRVLLIALLLSSSLLPACAGTDTRRPETAALDRAVPIALTALDGVPKGDGPYRLIGARQLTIDGRWVWHVTFKAERHLPVDPARDLMTAGGEIFVNVDAATGETSVGYGE